jgi:hypothetical protein
MVLYGCETWSLALREEHTLRVFENRVLRRIFGPKRDEVMGQWKKLNNKELHDLYSSPSIIRIIKSRRMRWAGNVARMGEKRSAYRLLMGKEDQDMGGWIILGGVLERWDGMMWTGLVWLRMWRALVNLVLNLGVPQNAGKLSSGLTAGGLTSSAQLNGVN